MQSKMYQTLCNIVFIFLFITVPVIYCAETNDSKAQSSKTVIVSWFWGLSGLGWFSDVRAGGRSVLGLMSPQHVWALSWGCRPEYLHVAASWSGFLTAWHWVQAWMSPRYQAEAEWLFMTYPQEFRDSISDAQITGLYRFEERKPVSCFHKNMCEILWPSWKIHWFFVSFYEECPHFSWLYQPSIGWILSIFFINSSFRFAQ